MNVIFDCSLTTLADIEHGIVVALFEVFLQLMRQNLFNVKKLQQIQNQEYVYELIDYLLLK